MPPSNTDYHDIPPLPAPTVKEQHIENDLIETLRDLKYTYRPDITTQAALENNFRQKFNALNAVTLTDSEFTRLLAQIISPDVYTAARTLRERSDFTRDDGTPLTFTLVNIKDWCKNTYEVVNQLNIAHDTSHHRYDVNILINGIPVTQIELKTLEVTPRKAMSQIVDYKKDPGNGFTNTLLCFTQLFIVSNHSNTHYFANNNNKHFAFDADEKFLPVYQHATRRNNKINSLPAFAKAFLPKCTLGHTISRYIVLVATERKMLMMRPYQVYAVQDIVKTIQDDSGNGYIWHTTGSGKTLTSFKAATLLKHNPNIEKCLFVVDRKDLDRQTREEFNRFQEKCVEENTNTHTLVQRLLSDDYADKVIVTTIQKLALALDPENPRGYKQQLLPLATKRIAIIFDECHRSQFGENHKAIKDFFPRSQLFGFTGTPIFQQNSTTKQATEIDSQLKGTFKTTKDIFQQQLHEYTITHAIEDKNVLKFQIDYFKPKLEKGQPAPIPGQGIDKRAIIEAIITRHDAGTAGRKFNAILATSSIADAIQYHHLFQTIQQEKTAENPDYRPLRIAAVFSPPAEGDKDVKQLQEDLPQEQQDNRTDPDGKKAALTEIIETYNQNFHTAHTITKFDAYYQDVQDRIKDQKHPNQDLPRHGAEKIDITIVVDMLLTGFDSKYLNTLYVDKNLKHHGLIQAFSRTNRVLNDTKPFGHILDFRSQQDAVDAAITLFSGGHRETARQIWLVDPAPTVIQDLTTAVAELGTFMHSQGLQPTPADVPKLKGDIARANFIRKFKEIQRLKTKLDQYTDLTPEQHTAIETTLPTNDHRAYKGVYMDTARQLREKAKNPDPSADPLPPEAQEIDFEFILFATATIDYDYIMQLLAEYTQPTAGKNQMSREQITALIASEPGFADQREQITAYVQTLQPGAGLTKEEITKGYQDFRSAAHTAAITTIADKHHITTTSLQKFTQETLRRMIFDAEALTELLAPRDLGWKDRTDAELALMADLAPLLRERADGQDISGLNAYEQ